MVPAVRFVPFVRYGDIPDLFGVIPSFFFGQPALFLFLNTVFFRRTVLDVYGNIFNRVLHVQISRKRIASKHEGFCRVWAGPDVGVVHVQASIVDYGMLYGRVYVIDVAVIVRVSRFMQMMFAGICTE